MKNTFAAIKSSFHSQIALIFATNFQIQAMLLQIADAWPTGTAVTLKSMNHCTIPIYTPLELDKSCATAAPQFCCPD